MANYAEPNERFVEVPGVVEIRWTSDDPDYYVKPIDLFDQQAKNEGLPDWYGKKNKATTEQAFFTCNVCECDLKSVVTLRAHCKGQQHIRKALNKRKEYRDSQKHLNKKDETVTLNKEGSRDKKEMRGKKSNIRMDREERRSCDNKRDYKRKRSRSRERPVAKRNNLNHDQKNISRSTEKSYEKCGKREVKTEEALELNRLRSRNGLKNDYEKENKYSKKEKDNDRERGKYYDDDRSRDDCYVKREEGVDERKYDPYREPGDSKEKSLGGNELVASFPIQAASLQGSLLATQSNPHQDAIDTLHRKVADCVKKRLNMYLVGQPDTQPKNMKINDSDEYAKLAKYFSHKMRDQIKETYEQYERTLEGIILTPDNREQIKDEIDRFFERRPVKKFD